MMKLVGIASIAGAAVLAGIVAAPPAAASLSREQLTDLCRPQLQTFVQEVLVDPPSEVATSGDDPEGSAKLLEEQAREQASLRANGINDPYVRQFVDTMRTEGAKQGKAAIRKGLTDMKRELRGIKDARGQGSEVAAAIAATCLMETMLADMEGRSPKAGGSLAASQSASAATAAARNKAAADAAARDKAAADAAAARAGFATAVPPLRPTATLEAHNPANEASQCLEIIFHRDFAARGVKSNMEAVFRNRCAFPVPTIWCIGEDRCATAGYDNLGTMPASGDQPISYAATPGATVKVRWGGCRQGFAYRPDFKGTLHYACK